MYKVKGPVWRNGLAVNVEDSKTSKDVMSKASLDWTVSKCELFAQMPLHVNAIDNNGGFVHDYNNYAPCPNAFATYRTDRNIPLGIVKERYTPVQNVDAFSFFDDAIGKNKAIWQTAGYFGNGERVYVCAKLPNTILINGDPVENYLVFSNSHDGSSGVKILLTPMRVICSNMLSAAIKSSTNYVSFRHTKSVHKNIDIAKEILGICEQKIYFVEKQYKRMANTIVKDKEAFNLFGNVILTEDEQLRIEQTGHTVEQIINRDWRAIEDSEISMKKVNVLSSMTDYYFNGIGQKAVVGTAWGVYNAVTGYYSNVDNSEGNKRMDSILYGDKSRKIELAGNLLLAA